MSLSAQNLLNDFLFHSKVLKAKVLPCNTFYLSSVSYQPLHLVLRRRDTGLPLFLKHKQYTPTMQGLYTYYFA